MSGYMEKGSPVVGEFIAIPAWGVEGMIIDVRESIMGSDDSVTVLLQEYPHQPLQDCRTYRLEPGEYSFES